MHRTFAVWLIGHPWHAAIVAAVLGFLSLQGVVVCTALAGAIPALVLLERGAKSGLQVMLVAGAALATLLAWLKLPVELALAYAVIGFGLPLMLAGMLRHAGSMNLVFQISVVMALLVIAVVFVAMPQPALVWQRFMNSALAILSQSGIQLDATLVPQLARTMWGAFMAMLLLFLMAAVFMARWWQSLLIQPGAFGAEFRELRAGVVLGTVLAMIAVLAWFTQLGWLDCMAWVAVWALALQGLASTHRRKAEGRLQHGWLVAIYVLLIVPMFSFVTVVMLAGVGFADFWRRMRVSAARA